VTQLLKNCGNCKLFIEIDNEKGECKFWKKEVLKNDYCIEYKSKEEVN
jgi:hypothetical protein